MKKKSQKMMPSNGQYAIKNHDVASNFGTRQCSIGRRSDMLASKWDGPQNVNFSNHQKARHKMACDKTAGLITAQTFSGRPVGNIGI